MANVEIDYVFGDVIVPGKVTKKQYEEITRLTYQDYNKLINLLCGLETVYDKKFEDMYTMYKVDIEGKKAEHMLDINSSIDGLFSGTLQTDGKNIYLHMYHPSIVGSYITQYYYKRYLFLPLVASVEMEQESGHALCVVIDNIDKKVYLMDPNGRTSYYDDVLVRFSKGVDGLVLPDEYIRDMYIDGSFCVKLLFEEYVKSLNEYTKNKFTFICSDAWNPTNSVLNRILPDENIRSGNCVAMTILLMHYLSKTNSSLTDVYGALAKLTDSEVVNVINSYTLTIHTLLNKGSVTGESNNTDYEKVNNVPNVPTETIDTAHVTSSSFVSPSDYISPETLDSLPGTMSDADIAAIYSTLYDQ